MSVLRARNLFLPGNDACSHVSIFATSWISKIPADETVQPMMVANCAGESKPFTQTHANEQARQDPTHHTHGYHDTEC